MSSAIVAYFPSATNYSIVALPLFFILGMVPNIYAAALSAGAQKGSYDNTSPRGEDTKDKLKKLMDPATYKMMERAKAAHFNTFESFPFVAAAVLAGNLARLPVQELNALVMGVGGLRVAFIALYITTTDPKLSPMRSIVWAAMQAWCFTVLWKAGWALS